jgi:hypothetical protein
MHCDFDVIEAEAEVEDLIERVGLAKASRIIARAAAANEVWLVTPAEVRAILGEPAMAA